MSSISNKLLQYAIEAAEAAAQDQKVQEDPIVAEELQEAADEQLNNAGNEIHRTVALCESLEALARRYEAADLSVESMDHYQFAVTQVLHASGVEIPSHVVCASFEAAEKDKKTIGEKAKAAVAAIVKYIVELWNKFIGLFTKRTAANKAKADANKEDLAAAKKAGPGPKREGADVPQKNKVATKVPEWAVKGTGLNTTAFDAVLAQAKTNPYLHGELNEATIKAFVTDEKFTSGDWKSPNEVLSAHFRDVVSAITSPVVRVEVDFDVNPGDVLALMEKFDKAAEDFYTDVAKYTATSGYLNTTAAMTKLVEAVGDPVADKRIGAYMTARLMYANNYYSTLTSIYTVLSTIWKAVK